MARLPYPLSHRPESGETRPAKNLLGDRAWSRACAVAGESRREECSCPLDFGLKEERRLRGSGEAGASLPELGDSGTGG